MDFHQVPTPYEHNVVETLRIQARPSYVYTDMYGLQVGPMYFIYSNNGRTHTQFLLHAQLLNLTVQLMNWKKYTSGPRYWNVPALVNTGTFLVYQYCLKMWNLRSLERAGCIQKQTILECQNGPVLSNTRVLVSGTWSILFPMNLIVLMKTDAQFIILCICNLFMTDPFSTIWFLTILTSNFFRRGKLPTCNPS